MQPLMRGRGRKWGPLSLSSWGPRIKAPISASARGAQGLLTSKAQAPDEVEENDGPQDTIKRDVGDEETGIVADGPGQVLRRETVRCGSVPPAPRHGFPTTGVCTQHLPLTAGPRGPRKLNRPP